MRALLLKMPWVKRLIELDYLKSQCDKIKWFDGLCLGIDANQELLRSRHNKIAEKFNRYKFWWMDSIELMKGGE